MFCFRDLSFSILDMVLPFLVSAVLFYEAMTIAYENIPRVLVLFIIHVMFSFHLETLKKKTEYFSFPERNIQFHLTKYMGKHR